MVPVSFQRSHLSLPTGGSWLLKDLMSVNGTPEVVACSNPDPRSEKLNSETALVFLEPVLAQR